MKKIALILLLLLVTIVPMDTQREVYLTVAIKEDLQSTNIFRATDEWSARILGWLYPSLYFRTGTTRELVPYAAEGMPEPLEEKVYAVHLKKDIKWDDGNPLTASDVEFTVNMIKELELVGYAPDLETVTRCTCPDAYTVVFELEECTPKFWDSVLTMKIVPKHQFLPILEEARKTDDPSSTFLTSPVMNPVGAGPFSWGVWMKGDFVRLPENPTYFFKGQTFQDGDRTITVGPEYDGLILKVYHTPEEALQALRRKDIDYIWWQLDPALTDSSSRIIPSVYGGFFLVMNHQKPPFNDMTFRQALACLTDQEELAKVALQGWGEPLYSVVIPTAGRWYNPDVKPQCYKMERDHRIEYARALLKIAGYSWDEFGQLLAPDGSPVPPITVGTPPADYDPLRVSAALMVAEWWSTLGVQVTVNPSPFADLVEETYTSQTFDISLLGWSFKGSYPSHLAFFFHSREAVTGGRNPQSYINPEVDRILEYFLLGCDQDSVVQASHDAQAIIMEEVGQLPLYIQYMAEAHREDQFTGWEPVCDLDMITTPQNPLLNLKVISRPKVLPEVVYTTLAYVMPVLLIFFSLTLVWMLMGGKGSFRVAFALLKRGFQAFTSYKLQLFFILLNVPLYILIFYIVGKPFVKMMFSSMTGVMLDYGGYDFVSFIFVALIAWPILWAGYDISARGIRYEQYTGMLEILVSTKYGVKVLPFSYLILGMLGSAFSSMGALAAFVYLLDLEVNITNPQAMLGLVSVAVISMLTMWGLGLLFSGLTVLYKQLGPASSILKIFLQAFCGIYVPVEILPEYMRPISKILPLTYSFNAVRASLITGESMLAYWKDSLALFGFCIFMVFTGYMMFNWLVNRARRLGSIYGY